MRDPALLVAGLVLLYFGAEWLIAGAAGLARSYRVPSLIVGLTVVAYGTSAPELVVGVRAAAAGQGAIALGNVVGSNVANLGLILAAAALILPPAIDRQVVRRELPVLLAATGLIPLVLVDGTVARWEAGALLGLAIGYSAWMIRAARIGSVADVREMEEAAETAAGLPASRSRASLAVVAIGGLALLVLGGDLLVRGAVGLAREVGMSDRLIGLTIVAVGTSLPELATSLIAAIRGHSDLAVGNVVGSNIFNILLIGGTAGLIGPIGVPLGDMVLDLVALGAMTALAAAVMATRPRFGRLAATVLLLGYIAFLIGLIAS